MFFVQAACMDRMGGPPSPSPRLVMRPAARSHAFTVQPEKWLYCAMFISKGRPIGRWSAVVEMVA